MRIASLGDSSQGTLLSLNSSQNHLFEVKLDTKSIDSKLQFSYDCTTQLIYIYTEMTVPQEECLIQSTHCCRCLTNTAQ